jgi:hypothetical protein
LNNKSVLNVLHDVNDENELKCLLGVINSMPFSVFYKARAVKGARTVFPKIVINNLRELPFPKTIGQRDKAALVALVDQINDMEKQRTVLSDEHRREVLKRVISEVDRKIDTLVCRLYGVDGDSIVSLGRVAETAKQR